MGGLVAVKPGDHSELRQPRRAPERPLCHHDDMSAHKDNSVQIRIGHHELVVRGRYETLSIANDVLIGIIFLAGSILFFSEATSTTGTWLFVVGRVLKLIRPVIRLIRRFHFRRFNPGIPGETARDF